MPSYTLSYYGEPQFDSQEEGEKHKQRFMAWVGDLGDAQVNPGTPLGEATTVSASGVLEDSGRDRLTGFSIVKADSMDAAVEIAKACPFAEFGTIDVAEVMEMRPQ